MIAKGVIASKSEGLQFEITAGETGGKKNDILPITLKGLNVVAIKIRTYE